MIVRRLLGVSLIAVVALAALAPILPLQDPTLTRLDARLLAPLAPGHLLGTDQLGRDLLARIVFGTRLSLVVAALGVGLAAGLGSAIGLTAAYAGGRLDAVLMRGVDVLLAFPYMLLALGIVAVLGPGLMHAGIAVAIANVAFFARSARGQALALVSEDFVAAARLAGDSHARIVAFELLPNVLPVLRTAMASSASWMILETAGLSFLGLGAQPPTADLGGMLGQARHLLSIAPHVTLLPGVVIFAMAVALNVLGERAVPHSARARPRPSAAPGGEPPFLAVDRLEVAFDTQAVLHDVSLRVRRGERVGILGESGSGKSTLARALLGLLPAGAQRAGSVRIDGEPPERAVALGLTAFVPQDPMRSLHPLYRVEQQLATVLASEECGMAAVRRQGEALLADLHMPDPAANLRAYPHELSGGMRQRVALALALARRPALLVLDEPTTALDPTVQAQLLARLLALAEREQLGYLFISHDIALVCTLCERVLVMQDGKIVEDAPVDALISAPRHSYTRALLDAYHEGRAHLSSAASAESV